MGREEFRGLVLALSLCAALGCDSSSGTNRVSDASNVEADDGDGGRALDAGDRGTDDREGGIVIPEDAGVASTCDPRTEFTCGDGRCIIRARQCDQFVDCADRSDEAKCAARCGVGDFLCNSGTCVDSSARCDGLRQCSDGSDELGCGTTCPGFRCADSTCVLASDRCDQIIDCADGSDEAACPSACNVVPELLSGWDGVPSFTRDQYMQCSTFCGDDDDCYTDANCPGIEGFNDCLNAEVLACSVNPGGRCRTEYETLTCCVDDRCGNDQSCIETRCTFELDEVRECIATDQSCLNASATRCFAP